MFRTKLLALAGIAIFAAGALAQAQNWPAKPIRAVIPFGAGSATDVVPRVVFEQMSRHFGQPIVVENRGGAGGTIGTAAVAKADPDAYTILATSSAHTLAPALNSNLSYDALSDFAAIGPIGNVPNVMIIAPSRGITSIEQFVREAKAKPGSFSFATLGVGSAVHMSAERFRLSAGYEAVHVPFKGGAEALTEVVAGRVDYYFCPISTALPFIQQGQLVPLAVSSATRAASLPNVPTTLEAGFPDSDYTFWIGLFAPAKTPRNLVDGLHTGLQAALGTPGIQERLGQLGVDRMDLGPAEFDRRVKEEIAAMAGFVTKNNLKVN